MHVPLYPLSAGELGTDPVTVEHQLRLALTCCKEWNALLLLDEADVFLERRSPSQLKRNELVSSRWILQGQQHPFRIRYGLTNSKYS